MIPDIAETKSLPSIIDSWDEKDTVLLFWEEASPDASISAFFDDSFPQMENTDRLWIIIGPEGGITAEEVQVMNDSAASVFMLSLGPTILRTETAGIAATALVLNELRSHNRRSHP